MTVPPAAVKKLGRGVRVAPAPKDRFTLTAYWTALQVVVSTVLKPGQLFVDILGDLVLMGDLGSRRKNRQLAHRKLRETVKALLDDLDAGGERCIKVLQYDDASQKLAEEQDRAYLGLSARVRYWRHIHTEVLRGDLRIRRPAAVPKGRSAAPAK